MENWCKTCMKDFLRYSQAHEPLTADRGPESTPGEYLRKSFMQVFHQFSLDFWNFIWYNRVYAKYNMVAKELMVCKVTKHFEQLEQ